MEFRTGIGYDLHPLKKGVRLVIGGVPIPYDKGLSGHSDGDIVLHALTDALLGAAGLGDIGSRFPDTDPQWKGIESRIFVEKSLALLRRRKFQICFVDCIILAEAPKLMPYFQAIQKKIALLLKITPSRVSVKAKTQEKLGSIGQKKAMAAFVAVTLKR